MHGKSHQHMMLWDQHIHWVAYCTSEIESWVEIQNRVYQSTVLDKSLPPPQCAHINIYIKEIIAEMKLRGIPDMWSVLHNLDDGEEEQLSSPQLETAKCILSHEHSYQVSSLQYAWMLQILDLGPVILLKIFGESKISLLQSQANRSTRQNDGLKWNMRKQPFLCFFTINKRIIS